METKHDFVKAEESGPLIDKLIDVLRDYFNNEINPKNVLVTIAAFEIITAQMVEMAGMVILATGDICSYPNCEVHGNGKKH